MGLARSHVYSALNGIDASSDITGHAEIDALRAASEGADTLGMCSCA